MGFCNLGSILRKSECLKDTETNTEREKKKTAQNNNKKEVAFL